MSGQITEFAGPCQENMILAGLAFDTWREPLYNTNRMFNSLWSGRRRLHHQDRPRHSGFRRWLDVRHRGRPLLACRGRNTVRHRSCEGDGNTEDEDEDADVRSRSLRRSVAVRLMARRTGPRRGAVLRDSHGQQIG